MSKSKQENKFRDFTLINLARSSTYVIHDLANSLTVLQHSISNLSEQRSEYGVNAASRSAQFVGEILGNWYEQPRPISINSKDVIQEVLDFLRSQIIACKIDLRTTVENSELELNSIGLKRVLFNLLTKSIKAFPAKQVNKRMRLSALCVPYYYRIELIDNAGGLPLEIISKLNDDPTYNLPSRKQHGIGLESVRFIVREVLNGKLEVSRIGKGKTMFCIYLPR